MDAREVIALAAKRASTGRPDAELAPPDSPRGRRERDNADRHLAALRDAGFDVVKAQGILFSSACEKVEIVGPIFVAPSDQPAALYQVITAAGSERTDD